MDTWKKIIMWLLIYSGLHIFLFPKGLRIRHLTHLIEMQLPTPLKLMAASKEDLLCLTKRILRKPVFK
jgi:hypothetical protein